MPGMATQKPSDDLRVWLDSLPEGPPWTADDPDPLIRKAVQHGFTTAHRTTSQPLRSGTETPMTTDGLPPCFVKSPPNGERLHP